METFLAKFSAGELIALVAVAGGLLCGIVAILGDYWHKIRKAEITAALKRDMLSRGMTAPEIQSVLEAGMKSARKERHGQHACHE